MTRTFCASANMEKTKRKTFELFEYNIMEKKLFLPRKVFRGFFNYFHNFLLINCIKFSLFFVVMNFSAIFIMTFSLFYRNSWKDQTIKIMCIIETCL